MYPLWLIGLLLLINVSVQDAVAQDIYFVQKSKVEFNSNAPNEIIKAASDKLEGVVDIAKRQFVYKVDVRSFQGFNIPLQQEHFNENYMESSRYPDIIFSGKIIEDINLKEDGEYDIRAKGKLKVHGKAVDRILKVHVSMQNGLMSISSQFDVQLAAHDIKIPRLVNDKLATEVLVNINALLMPRKE